MSAPAPRLSRDGSRRPVILAAGIAIVAVAAGIAFLFGGSSPTLAPTGTPAAVAGATPVYPDLSLVPVVTTPTPAASVSPGSATSPAGSGSSPPSIGPGAATAGREIRATRIQITRLGINLQIIDGDGIGTPMGKVAHYPGTAWPGGGSNIYIYGHAQPGMFLGLWKARVGDTIELDLVDGTTRNYVVDQVLAKVPWNAMKYVQPTSTEQLTLQTCTSNYPTAPRFIVIAVPAP